MKLRQKAAVAIAAISLASVAGVGPVHAGSAVGGGGASFLANMMDICSAQYNRNTASNTSADTFTYASVGSSAGKTGFANNTYKFGGSESAYSSGAPAGLVYVPLVGGAIAIGYRVDGMQPAGATVRLTSELVAKIFAGQIKTWNDPAIAAVNKATTVAKKLKATKDGVTVSVAKKASNVQFAVSMTSAAAKKYKNAKVTISATVLGGTPTSIYSAKSAAKLSKTATYKANTVYTVKAGKTLVGTLAVAAAKDGETITFPATPIRVVHRSDGSGTTNNFINFLNKSFPSIWTKVTSDTYSSGFPGTVPTDGSFQSAKGNEGLASYVRDNNGSITYAELSYLEERGVKAAAVSNPAGKYVLPSAVSSAVWLDAAEVSADGLVTQNFAAKAADAYPINAVSYGLSSTAVSATNASVKSFFSYFLNTCAPKNAAGAGYTPLTGAILTKALAQVSKINPG
jgi:ABC-type phosphate transport system substrate-binding protein